MAQVRSTKGSAQASNFAVCWLVARTVTLATSRSSPQMATAVWLALWGSTPMITMMSTSSWVDGNREGTPDSDLVHTPLSSHIAARSRREAIRSKANRDLPGGRHKESRPVRTSKRYGSAAGSAQSLNQALWGWSKHRDGPLRNWQSALPGVGTLDGG